MKYMLLLYAAPDQEPAFGTPEFDKMMEDFALTSETFEKDGVLVGGEGLQEVETATSLRIKSGKVETMDGPFAETREPWVGIILLTFPIWTPHCDAQKSSQWLSSAPSKSALYWIITKPINV